MKPSALYSSLIKKNRYHNHSTVAVLIDLGNHSAPRIVWPPNWPPTERLRGTGGLLRVNYS